MESPALFLKSAKDSWMGGLAEPEIRQWLETLHSSIDVLEFREKLGILLHAGANPQLVAAAAGGLFEDPPAATGGSSADFEALTQRVQQKQREQEIRSLSAQIKLTARMGDTEEQQKLLNRLRELRSL
jgi:thioredoxin-like negative regulator of GroEL